MIHAKQDKGKNCTLFFPHSSVRTRAMQERNSRLIEICTLYREWINTEPGKSVAQNDKGELVISWKLDQSCR